MFKNEDKTDRLIALRRMLMSHAMGWSFGTTFKKGEEQWTYSKI